MKTGYIVGIIIAVLVVGGGVVALTKKDKNTTPNTTSTSSDNSTNTTTPAADSSTNSDTSTTPATENQITYNGSSFSPSSITVKAGTAITIKNDSKSTLNFNSDPHPTHTDNLELNVGGVKAGETTTVTVNKTGDWGYHNHLNPTQKGRIIVQ